MSEANNMNDRIANDLIRYAELVEDGALISPEEMNCASLMRLAAEALSSPNGEAQPEQEPVGFAVMQKPWVGLTDEEIEHIIVSVPFADEEDYEVVIRAAVAKLKEKNTRNGGCL